jgi:hypothetical protein
MPVIRSNIIGIDKYLFSMLRFLKLLIAVFLFMIILVGMEIMVMGMISTQSVEWVYVGSID